MFYCSIFSNYSKIHAAKIRIIFMPATYFLIFLFQSELDIRSNKDISFQED